MSTPLVQHLTQPKGVDLSSVHGSGKGCRTTRSDVEHTPAEVPHQVKASPLARRLALSSDVDLSALKGTGRGGTIRAEDVRAATAGPASRTVESREPARPSSATAEPTESDCPASNAMGGCADYVASRTSVK